MIDEIKAAMAELEYAGIIERTGEMEWSERHHEWQPVTFTRNLDEHSPRPGSVSTSIKHDYQTSHRNIRCTRQTNWRETARSDPN